ncbi:MAG TPA: aminotransferase class V-fold PLP-dependent enzyme [Thermoanaerobaculia bacterium]|nr:aminotransferase class V-fold PLP-dependent enzyme [Thermoanaerobaculia bacterium]
MTLEDDRRSFLPGPVPVHPEVVRAFARPAISHRSAPFHAQMGRVRRRLCDLVGLPNVQLLVGSGTLANDAVAAQLSLLPGRGLVLSNGEFGERLIEQAERFGLKFTPVRSEWGAPLPLDEIVGRSEPVEWLWAVHCETSTGVLNDLPRLTEILRERGIKLCVDAISSVGNWPVDLSGAWLATATSGKGLAAYPGLGLVFHRDAIVPSPRLPRYLDLGLWAREDGVPFTASSNLLAALECALEIRDADDGHHRARLAEDLRPRVERLGFRCLAAREIAAPWVLTLLPPEGTKAFDLGERLEAAGFLLSYRSGYLVRRNWLQVCLMGEHTPAALDALLDRLAAACEGMPVP